MKVTMVMVSSQNGGLEKHVRELSQQLVLLGHSVAVIAPPEYLQTLSSDVEQYPISDKLSRHNPVALWQLLRQLRRAGGHVVHAQANKAAYMVGLLKPWLKRPVVATLHNVKSQLNVFKAYTHVITVSSAIGQGFDAQTNVNVIYNGIAKPVIKPLDLRARFDLSAKPVIVAVGRLVEAKGFDLLLKAIDGLAVNLLIIGDGPEREQLVRQGAKVQSPTVVKFLGHCTDVPDLMAASDALVIASRREGFSYVLVEALHSQCRILSTNVPDVGAALPPALIVPTESIPALREKLRALLTDMDGWHQAMQPAWEFAAQQLTCEAMAKQTAGVYQQVLQSDH